MNPTLSERLRARRMEPYWRAHPPVRWGVALEQPLALQVLEAGTTPTATTASATAAPMPESEPPALADDLAIPSALPAAIKDAPPHQELVLLLLTAVVWLIDGWRALGQAWKAGERLGSLPSRQRPNWSGRARNRATRHQDLHVPALP
ncbi:hypothetical protein CPCC7001_2148 [Cyanobium sp. PCC 7001]|uniref:hypothetical protein n=1 Tax=Cyanobium sp. PCC 7001 TaxID=180281 RepID=UPI00018052A3|nr:hypothetical protein [Cyanobium sp. PCC 7001]EDY39268.1 hypothetical protein CPCC7001_2148 [Cyanobium sp. PCC 7001]